MHNKVAIMDCVTMETVGMATEQLNSNTSSSSPAPTPPHTNGNEVLSSTLTIRMIMQGKVGQKEAGSIIGKKGDNVKKFREDSGAKINISDASCPERIVTVSGTTDQIYKAFTMICRKFEEVRFQDIQMTNQSSTPSTTIARPPITVRLVVPASQCGSLIGKGGSKIKEIREITGASIQVASEMLPNSTERAVTVSGSADSITKCIYHICCVMLESPPKGATIPYRPKPALPPVLFAATGNQASAAYAVPQGPYTLPPQQSADPRGGGSLVQFPATNPIPHHPHQHAQKLATVGGIQPGLLGHPIPMLGAHPLISVPGSGVAVSPSLYSNTRQGVSQPHAANPSPHQQAHEMTIPNDLIGCIIGRGGSKINEIRQLSGATIKIANVEEGSSDRKVTISGNPETIHAAQYLINASIEMHKQQLAMDPTVNPLAPAASSAMSMTPAPSAQQMAPLVVPPANPPATALLKPMPLLSLAGTSGVGFFPAQSVMTTKIKSAPNLLPAQAAAAAAAAFKKNGNKFTPY